MHVSQVVVPYSVPENRQQEASSSFQISLSTRFACPPIPSVPVASAGAGSIHRVDMVVDQRYIGLYLSILQQQ